MKREPATLVGLMMALRYGAKSLSGFSQGRINLRWGMRAPLLATVVLASVAVLWGWTVPGTLYLFSFALMGAGELGGVYFPNYVLATSKASDGARNISVLQLTNLPISLSPLIYGQLTDRLGFGASFIFAGVAGLGALWLALKLPEISVSGEAGSANKL